MSMRDWPLIMFVWLIHMNRIHRDMPYEIKVNWAMEQGIFCDISVHSNYFEEDDYLLYAMY